jgi:fumarate hydratase class II
MDRSAALTPGATRIERDSMGEMRVPATAYYGAQTQRAVENFPISGFRFTRPFIRALGMIKAAAAETNRELGLVEPKLADAIARAAEEVVAGALDQQFVLDIFQTGSGTSTNMNANEVIANRAIELLGGQIGSRTVHPNDHVNFGQSSNDVIPTAIHVAARLAIDEDLIPALRQLAAAFSARAQEFAGIPKTGRTHLQDATPVTLGQVFQGYASQIEHGIRRLEKAGESLAELALGGTAVGTGLNTHPDFPPRVIAKLAARTKIPFREAEDHFEAQSGRDAAVETSGALKVVAVSLTKIANDLRWLGSGPRNGLGELSLPEVQPGSSIMPGKVNPVIAESVLMVAAQVIGNDLAVTIGGQAGNFELNVMMPLIAHNLLQSIALLAASARNFEARLVRGLKADEVRIRQQIEESLALCTSLAPVIGYDAAADIAKEAAKSGRTVREVAMERRVLPPDELDRVLDPRAMTQGGFLGGKPQAAGG